MLEGSLTKWTNAFTGWNKCYFILDGEVMTYYKKRGGKVQGRVDLAEAKVVPNSLYPNRFKIFIGKKYMHLKAYSVEEARQWLAALMNPVIEAYEAPKPHTKDEHHFRLSLQPDQLMSVVSQLKHLNDKVIHLAKTLQASSKDLALSPLQSMGAHEQHMRNSEFSGLIRTTIEEILEASEASSSLLSQVSVDMLMEDVQNSDSSIEFYDAVEEEPVEVHRAQLPVQKEPGQKLSIWKVIKDSIGKDLSKISVPVYFNEPLSFIQRFSEQLTYAHLLEEASQMPDQAKRIAYVAAFASSSYSSSLNRTMKPFNPLLGETFELQKGLLKVVSEQVSHHPPVTAVHAEHPDYRCWGSMQPTTKFKGSYMQVRCLGMMHVEFPRLGEHYTWEKPNSSVHNIMVGNIYIDHHGSFVVRDTNSVARAEVHFDKRGWFAASSKEIRAEVFDASGTVKYTLTGNWETHFILHNLASLEERRIWEPFPLPLDYERNYFMTDFAMQLNHPPECYPRLPSTDTRWRPDQRAYENGDLETAITEKNRLEEKQRLAKRIRDETHERWSPMWFSTLGGEWKYQGGYWERRSTGQLDSLPDIF
jgi:hypothetical protein